MAKSRARKLADLIVTAGVDIDGNLTFDGGSTSADLTFADNDKANFGDASDLQIYHDGSSNLIQGSNGSLYIQAKAGENSILATPDGGVNIYHDNSLKLETTAAGATLTGALTATNNINGLNLVATTATYSPIVYGGSSNLQLKSNTAEMFAQFVNNGAAELYYDNTKKLETTSTGATVTGVIRATGGELYLGEADTASAHINSYEVMTFNIDSDNDDTNRYFGWFKNGNSGSGTSLMRLTEDGYLGIGTDTPGRALEVSTDGTAQFRLSRVDSTINGNNTLGTIEFWGTDDTSGTIGATIVAHAASTWGGGAYPTDLRFSTMETSTLSERMRIDSSGNVGIGVSPATDWNSGYDALQIGQGVAIMSANFSEELFLNNNAKWASDSSWEYIATGTAASIRMDQTTPFTFRYAASGTADTDLTWSEAMRIDSSGKVLVGTTSSVVDSSSTNFNMVFPNNGGIAIGSVYTFANIYGNLGNLYLRANAYPANTGSDSIIYLQTATSVGGQADNVVVRSGKVGIGNSSPTKKLHVGVGGSSGASNYGVDGIAIEGSGNVGIQFMGGAANQQGLTFSDSGATEAGYVYYNHASNNLLLKAESNLIFNSGGANEKMRLDPSGNLLIGTDVASAKLYAKTGAEGVITKFEGPTGRYVYSGTDGGGHYMEVTGTQASERVLRLQGNNGSGTYTQLFIDAGNQRIYTSSTANVGIGTTSPAYTLDLLSATAGYIARFKSSENYGGVIVDAGTSAGSAGGGYFDVQKYGTRVGLLAVSGAVKGNAETNLSVFAETGKTIEFYTNGLANPKAIIDTTGNLLVGTTVLTDISSSGPGNEGAYITPDGTLGLATSNQGLGFFNRKTSNGEIFQFRKDGTAVGSIGVEGGDSLYIGNGDAGIKFSGGADVVQPFNPSTVAARDAAIDLGTSGARFKDLYLSGGVVFPDAGGTGNTATSNRLDDYEEGTWSPTITGNSGASGQTYAKQIGYYVRIGKFVHLTYDVELTNVGTISGTYLTLGGIPFSAKGANVGGTVVTGYVSGWSTNIKFPIGAYISGATAYLMEMGEASNYIRVAENLHSSSSRLIGSMFLQIA